METPSSKNKLPLLLLSIAIASLLLAQAGALFAYSVLITTSGTVIINGIQIFHGFTWMAFALIIATGGTHHFASSSDHPSKFSLFAYGLQITMMLYHIALVFNGAFTVLTYLVAKANGVKDIRYDFVSIASSSFVILWLTVLTKSYLCEMFPSLGYRYLISIGANIFFPWLIIFEAVQTASSTLSLNLLSIGPPLGSIFSAYLTLPSHGGTIVGIVMFFLFALPGILRCLIGFFDFIQTPDLSLTTIPDPNPAISVTASICCLLLALAAFIVRVSTFGPVVDAYKKLIPNGVLALIIITSLVQSVAHYAQFVLHGLSFWAPNVSTEALAASFRGEHAPHTPLNMGARENSGYKTPLVNTEVDMN